LPGNEPTSVALTEFALDVRSGLLRKDQKEIPSKYLYDDLGSMLFEAITLLPEYGATDADRRLLQRNAADLAGRLPGLTAVVELGSGSGKKTRWLLEELAARHATHYFPIDISSAALKQCRQEMEAIPNLTVEGLEGSYLPGLREAKRRRPEGSRLLVLFLGSTIGNFQPEEAREYLSVFRSEMDKDDHFLLSTDLVKPVEQVLAAYDDALGVTAAFNLNLLTRINRELGGDFDLSEFEHLALYNHAEQRIEMHILSLRDQSVSLPEADLTLDLQKHETLWTESSHKFTLEGVRELAERSGFRCEQQWVDEEWPFAQSLLIAA